MSNNNTPVGCEDCKFFKKISNHHDDNNFVGECHRHPPSAILLDFNDGCFPPPHSGVSSFPIVRCNDWCGDFKAGEFPKEKPQTAMWYLKEDKEQKTVHLDKTKSFGFETLLWQERCVSQAEAEQKAKAAIPGLCLAEKRVIRDVSEYYGYVNQELAKKDAKSTEKPLVKTTPFARK